MNRDALQTLLKAIDGCENIRKTLAQCTDGDVRIFLQEFGDLRMAKEAVVNEIVKIEKAEGKYDVV